jgi:TonB family protein
MRASRIRVGTPSAYRGLFAFCRERSSRACIFALILTLWLCASPSLTPQDASKDTDADEPVFEITGDITPPRVLRQKAPEYTDRARRGAVRGIVLLRFVVSSKGLPLRITVAKGLEEDLDQAAVNALKEWRFSPALKDKKPVAVEMSLEFVFGVL